MKNCLVIGFLLLLANIGTSQTAPVYIYFGSHNESDDVTHHGLNYANPGDFADMKVYVQQVCDTFIYYNASYEMMLESNFVLGALANDNAHLSATDIIEWADNQSNIEVQSHNHFDPTGMPPNPYNSTDIVYLLDSCGVDTAHVLGGFIWKNFLAPPVSEDWTQWQTPQPGNVFSNAPNWQPTLLWGGGSPMHTQDYEAYGIWRPTGPTDANFGVHDEFGTLVNFGNGCGEDFVLYDTTNATLLAYRIINFVDSIHANYDGNPDAFFNLKVMINFRHFPSAGYIDKIGTILEIINPYVLAGRMEYMGIMDIYQEWQNLHPSDADYFLSKCDTTAVISNATPQDLGIEKTSVENSLFRIFPNPAQGDVTILFNDSEIHNLKLIDLSGRTIYLCTVQNSAQLDLSSFKSGTYLISIDDQITDRLILN